MGKYLGGFSNGVAEGGGGDGKRGERGTNR